MITTTATQIATMPAGGRFLRAVPYSSPMLKSDAESGAVGGEETATSEGGAGGWTGTEGSDMSAPTLEIVQRTAAQVVGQFEWGSLTNLIWRRTTTVLPT